MAIARAIIVPPRLLLCDEPVSAMDVSLAAAILNLLATLRLQLGMAMLFVTHDLAAARFIAERIIVLRTGEIVETGASDAVIGSRPTSVHEGADRLDAVEPGDRQRMSIAAPAASR